MNSAANTRHNTIKYLLVISIYCTPCTFQSTFSSVHSKVHWHSRWHMHLPQHPIFRCASAASIFRIACLWWSLTSLFESNSCRIGLSTSTAFRNSATWPLSSCSRSAGSRDLIWMCRLNTQRKVQLQWIGMLKAKQQHMDHLREGTRMFFNSRNSRKFS